MEEKYRVELLDQLIRGHKVYVVVGDQGTIHKNTNGRVMCYFTEQAAEGLAKILSNENVEEIKKEILEKMQNLLV